MSSILPASHPGASHTKHFDRRGASKLFLFNFVKCKSIRRANSARQIHKEVASAPQGTWRSRAHNTHTETARSQRNTREHAGLLWHNNVARWGGSNSFLAFSNYVIWFKRRWGGGGTHLSGMSVLHLWIHINNTYCDEYVHQNNMAAIPIFTYTCTTIAPLISAPH